MPNDDNTIPVNGVILWTARIEYDIITGFNSDGSKGAFITENIISESCNSVFNKLNKINESIDLCGNNNGSRPRSSGAPPTIIIIPISSPTSTPEEKVNSPTKSTNFYENNETNINKNVLKFVLN